jgi:shikimate dehydrogenase
MRTKYGLIGASLAHSFSKKYFTQKFAALDIDAVYDNYELQAPELKEFLASTDCNFFNVTIPYKQNIFTLVHMADEIAKSVQACNCIKRVDGLWHATNTDAIALEQILSGYQLPEGTRALICGTGGASAAVQYACKQVGIPFILVSRRQALGTILYDDVSEQLLAKYQLIINTTPLGMYPNTGAAPPLPYAAVSSKHTVLDLVYNPESTLFLQKCAQQGARVENGINMLKLQAEASWQYWLS